MIFLCKWWRVAQEPGGDEVEQGRVLNYPFRSRRPLGVVKETLTWNSAACFLVSAQLPVAGPLPGDSEKWSDAGYLWNLKAQRTTIAGRLDVGSEKKRGGARISFRGLAEQMEGHLLRSGRQLREAGFLGRWSEGFICKWITGSHSWLVVHFNPSIAPPRKSQSPRLVGVPHGCKKKTEKSSVFQGASLPSKYSAWLSKKVKQKVVRRPRPAVGWEAVSFCQRPVTSEGISIHGHCRNFWKFRKV